MIKVQNDANGRYVSLTLRGSEVEDVEYFVDSLLNIWDMRQANNP